jgi:hypothetical protein
MRGKALSVLPVLVASSVLACGLAAADSKYRVSEVKKDEYRVGVKYQRDVQAGHMKTARIYVVAGAGWKINPKFPWKIELSTPDGVTASRTVFKKTDAAVMNDRKAVFKVGYKATSAGDHQLKAKVKLSVCKGTTQCLFPTENLKWTVSAAGE